MLRPSLLLAACASSLLSAEPDKAPPRPPAQTPPAQTAPSHPAATELDAVTARRAEKAAKEYEETEEANKVPVSAEALTALADAEVQLLECRTFLDQGDALKAGERYLDAGKRLTAIEPGDRRRLADRYRKASDQLLALSMQLIALETYDPHQDADAPKVGKPKARDVEDPTPAPKP